MAIIEISGGKGGVIEYLESGIKDGMRLSRAQRDERVALYGNQEITRTIISEMDRQPDAERYIHWSFSFTEDHIPDETLRAIALDCAEFFGAAYQPEELNQYMEAHRPRQKFIQNEKGEMVKQFTHIHGVIPTINLKSGRRANPLERLMGKYGSEHDTYEFVKAFQESLNRKYGLSSPRDVIAAKAELGDMESVKKHKFFERLGFKPGIDESSKNARTEEERARLALAEKQVLVRSAAERKKLTASLVADALIGKKIESMEALGRYLKDDLFAGKAVVTFANSEKVGRYFKVTFERTEINSAGVEESKEQTIRLDMQMFTEPFISLKTDEKIALISRNDESYQEPHPPIKENDHESGNRDKRALADGVHAIFATIQDREFDSGGESPERLSSVPTLSSLSLANELEQAQVLLRRDAPGDLGDRDRGERRNNVLRWSVLETEILKAAAQAQFSKDPSVQAEQVAIRDAELMRDWTEIRSKEIRYVHPSNKWAKEKYFKMTREEKSAVLEDMAAGRRESDEEQRTYDLPSERFNKYKIRVEDEMTVARKEGDDIIQNFEGAADNVIKILTANESVVSRHDLESYLMERTADLEQYDKALERVLQCEDLVVVQSEGRNGRDGVMRYTSQSIIDIEKNLVEDARALTDRRNENTINVADIDTSTMNAGQRIAFNALCSEKLIEVVNGAAGTGKSFILAKMNQAAIGEGLTVHGAILQGKTAQDLERDSGIKSQTIHSMLKQYEDGKLKFHDRSVIVVDEAGMVGSEQLGKLIGIAETTGCRLRLIGDTKQIQAVSYGNAFEKVSDITGHSDLTEIMRQKIDWQREASEAFSRHDIKSGLDAYNDRGFVNFEQDTSEAIDSMVARIREDRNNSEFVGQTSVVIAKTNADRKELNYLIRQDMLDEGRLGADEITCRRVDDTLLHLREHDRIIFSATNKDIDVKNGTSATIHSIEDGRITAQLENGELRSWSAEDQHDIDYAYCVTGNKSQGMTVDRSYVLASRYMTANDLYVAETRHRNECHLFVGRDQFKNYEEMSAKMSRAASKTFTDEHTKMGDASSMIDRLMNEHRNESMIVRESTRATIKEIKSVDPQRLLDTLAHSNAINKDLYSVTKEGKIRCGSKDRSVVDFLTKEIGMDYKSMAVPAMREMYRDQLEKRYIPPVEQVEKKNLLDFGLWRKERAEEYKRMKKEMDAYGRAEKKRFADAGSTVGLEEFKERMASERARLKATYEKPVRELYEDFKKEKGLNAPQKQAATDGKETTKHPDTGHQAGVEGVVQKSQQEEEEEEKDEERDRF